MRLSWPKVNETVRAVCLDGEEQTVHMYSVYVVRDGRPRLIHPNAIYFYLI